jgi:hypothetical protein
MICRGFSAIFLDHAFGCRARTPAAFESRGDFQITVRNKFISARAVDASAERKALGKLGWAIGAP